MSSQLLRLNAFRGEPASSGFECHFTPNHNSSADSSTSIGSDLDLVFPRFTFVPQLFPPASYLRFSNKKNGNKVFRCISRTLPLTSVLPNKLMGSMCPRKLECFWQFPICQQHGRNTRSDQ
jgi:hypothetical protein